MLRCAVFVLTLLLAIGAEAALTEDQSVVLHTDILTGPNSATLAPLVADTKDQDIADFYNALASPVFWVWRTAVSRDALLFATSVDGTTFDFAGAGYLTRTVQELQLFESLFNHTTGLANPSIPQVRTAVGSAISGATAPAPANRTHMLTVSRRQATWAEKLFATGTGTPGTTGNPATMAFEGMLTSADVAHAFGR